MEHHSDAHPAELSPNEARGSRKTSYMKYVLGISLFAVSLIALIWFVFITA